MLPVHSCVKYPNKSGEIATAMVDDCEQARLELTLTCYARHPELPFSPKRRRPWSACSGACSHSRVDKRVHWNLVSHPGLLSGIVGNI